MSGPQYRLTGSFEVALSPDEAFPLFTPRGEEEWVAGWHPRFPIPVHDDTAPGTVFETAAHNEVTTWVVLDRERPRHISYVRVTPQSRAGTVTIAIDGTDSTDGHSVVQVTYALTALSPAGELELKEFAATYPAFLLSWQDAIATHSRPGRQVKPQSGA